MTKSLTDLPEDLLLHIFHYCPFDAATLCALEATCKLFHSPLIQPFWGMLALREFGGCGQGGKRAYLAGRALTTGPPIQFRRDNLPLQGEHRYVSCLAASSSLIVMAVAPHPETRERLQNFPIQVLHAETLKEASCWPMIHEPCRRVAIVANDIVVLQRLSNEVWACHGCAKVKVLLPHETADVRDMVGSQHDLALVQEDKLCLYIPSTHAALALYETLDLDETFHTGPCALNWSLDHNWLAFAGGTKIHIFQRTGATSSASAVAARSKGLVQVNVFRHGMHLNSSATIAVSSQYVVLSRRLGTDEDIVRIYDPHTGRSLRQIVPNHWLMIHASTRLYVSIVAHYLVISATQGVGLSLVDMRDGRFVRHLSTEEDHTIHSMVTLPNKNALSFMVTFNGGNQMVWSFAGCQLLI